MFFDDLQNSLKNINFSKGFVDGVFAAEGHADAHKSGLKAIITQNRGQKADCIEKALKLLKLRFYLIKDRETKLQFRIASNSALRQLYSFCEISKDKLDKIIPLLAGKYKLSKRGISHSILDILNKHQNISLKLLYPELGLLSKDVVYWYLKNKRSPLLKYRLVKQKANMFAITHEGKEVLETLGASQ